MLPLGSVIESSPHVSSKLKVTLKTGTNSDPLFIFYFLKEMKRIMVGPAFNIIFKDTGKTVW